MLKASALYPIANGRSWPIVRGHTNIVNDRKRCIADVHEILAKTASLRVQTYELSTQTTAMNRLSASGQQRKFMAMANWQSTKECAR